MFKPNTKFSSNKIGHLNRNTAFTLAEVLITLGIIGIIAAITIPNLILNYQKQAYVAQLKKSYNSLLVALQDMTADLGCTGDLACTKLAGTDKSPTTLAAELLKHFNGATECPFGALYVHCHPYNYKPNYDGSGTTQSLPGSSSVSHIALADGSTYRMQPFGNCALPNDLCIILELDVNGKKGPNYRGRDIFEFYIYSKGPKIGPFGSWKDASGDPAYCYEGNKDGFRCSSRIMEDGWEMNY